MTTFQANFLKKLSTVLTWPALLGVVILRKLLCGKIHYETLVLRPGGMGDLILAAIAIEDMGLNPAGYHWLIEKRSEAWARRIGLNYTCYDKIGIGGLWKMRGCAKLVINTEQRFGLAQAVALWMTAATGSCHSFESVHGSSLSDQTVTYHVVSEYEAAAFARLFAKALRVSKATPVCMRHRRLPASHPPVVCVAGTASLTRKIPVETLAKLIKQWKPRLHAIKVSSAPSDVEYAQKLVDLLGEGATLLQTDFDGLCDYIAASECILTVDGGPVHIASYYGVPVTAIFTSGVNLKWRPNSMNSEIVRRQDLCCMPCTRFGQTPVCKFNLACHELDYNIHHYKITE